MWLINSPIGRKVVMSLTGICLILFLTFHCCMNVAAFFSGYAYNEICEFLGSNWYAVVGTLGLAFLAVCHIVYAFILTAQNRRARGSERYAVTDRRPGGQLGITEHACARPYHSHRSASAPDKLLEQHDACRADRLLRISGAC